jgi:hypothetical protein
MKKEETGGWREARGLVHLEVSPQGPALSLRRYIWCPTSSNDVQVAYHVSVYATDHACSNRWAARIRRGPFAQLAFPYVMVEDADLPARRLHFVEKIRCNALDPVPQAAPERYRKFPTPGFAKLRHFAGYVE